MPSFTKIIYPQQTKKNYCCAVLYSSENQRHQEQRKDGKRAFLYPELFL
jgi:hypothetical protein